MLARIESLRRAKPSLRSLVALLVTLSLVALPALPATMTAPAVRVLVDAVEVLFPDQIPVISAGRTLVPLRFVSQDLGATVTWDDATSSVTMVFGSTRIVLVIGRQEITVNGVSRRLDVPAQIIGGRTMVPIRGIFESLGATVSWDQATNSVIITRQQAQIPAGPQVTPPTIPRHPGTPRLGPELVAVGALPNLTMEPRTPSEDNWWRSRGAAIPFLGPRYFKTFRIQIGDISHDPIKGWRVEFQLGNTGNSPIVLNSENARFYMLEGAHPLSSIEGGEVTIEVGEMREFAVLAANPMAGTIIMEIQEESLTIFLHAFRDREGITDVEPTTAGSVSIGGLNYPLVLLRRNYSIAGNGMFKAQAMYTVLLENENIGEFRRPKGGRMGLVAVRIANTTERPMTLERLFVGSVDMRTEQRYEYSAYFEEVKSWLQERTIPSTILPNEIVEGYLPFIFANTYHLTGLSLRSSHGVLAIQSIESFFRIP